MQKQFMLTEERLKEIKDELEYLKTVREKEDQGSPFFRRPFGEQ